MSDKWFLESIKEKNDILAISFSGAPFIFEWKNTFEREFPNLNVLYVRDDWLSWWHGAYVGLNGYGVHVLKNFIESKINEYESKRIFAIGASKGGYGALLLGCLLNIDSVFAFSPKTRIDKGINKKYFFQKYINEVYKTFPDFILDKKMLDLKDVFTNYGQNNKTIYKILYGSKHSNDDEHAKNISSFKNVELYTIEEMVHKTARIFLSNGTVTKLIKEFIKE
jgi:predicted esterase YcpF (UPF0227 family)